MTASNPEEVLRAAAQRVLARYQAEQFLRTADFHRGDCDCKRCEFDALEAALAATSVKVQPVDGVEEATREARELAISLHQKHFPEVVQWQPLDDLRGIISQIDNMTTGLSRHSAPLVKEGERG